MNAKDFLNQAYLLDQQIKSKSEQIQSLNELATSCTATMTGMPHNPNRGTSRMADAVCKIIDLQNEIASDMDRLVQIKNAGGGIAETGGYIAGKKDLVEKCSYRLTTPGLGKEVGATLGHNRERGV